ncbi:MAG: long-chain-fatty-acid--CoA ligase [Thermincola sp.]|nr:long-chain-fatty-acid--CoA ligase [Thermincola sp.]
MRSIPRHPLRAQMNYMTRIGDIVHANARRYPNRTSIIFRDKSYTWKETNERVNSLAHALLDLGLKKEDRVGVISMNTGQYLEVPFATSKAGLICVPLNFRLSPEEYVTQINNCGAKVLIVGTKFVETIMGIKDRIPNVEHFIGMADATGENHGIEKDYDVLATSFPTSEPDVEVDENDIYMLMYTGGTTGLPKGAVYIHRTVFTWLLNCAIIERVTPSDVYMVTPPIFHLGVQFPYLVYWYLGCTTVVAEEFNPSNLLQMVEKYRITVTMLQGTMLNLIRALPGIDNSDYDISSLRLLEYGAAPISRETLLWAKGHFKCSFHQIAGGTEAGMSVADLWPDEHVIEGTEKELKRLASAGREAPNAWVRIVDTEGNEVPPGVVGEIASRSVNTMEQYWNKVEENDQAFRHGWLHMGDMAYRDEDGYIYYVDRSKDMIISGGENIFTLEVERTINAHPAVIESAVIGIPDNVWGESVHALVILKQDYEPKPTPEEIILFCKDRLASYKKPKSVEFTDSFPRTAMGKLQKAVLRQKYWATRERGVN